ncbi:hypothetical protein HKBW3S06_00382 [Candidatus Hakubella thermalkaliphila]|uniref:GTP cyclohydrolase 1 type 2 homolog n=1 Tax=Candidatus Hakubella thermalkaliphila TaxID=2754717 RepID=A0A6V8NRU7_9ACTN|nr:Nif3-like dinuclear metal center hexameric protein [Candidatus Hakubella thermalkaliphila]GFP21156.1 hypothetical protein HKBW3S06_00382 [Candidatus Hakubella thermalkaliphila]
MDLKQVSSLLDEIFPPDYAVEWDKVGLQIGDLTSEVHRILVALDVTSPVVQEAYEKDVDLVIAHHPLIFSPLSRILSASYPEKVVMRVIKEGLALYVLHTNLDAMPGGLNDFWAERMGLKRVEAIDPEIRQRFYKIAVFVPETHVEKVRSAMGQAGAGKIGNYEQCSFRTRGIGTFLPLEGATPYLGQVGKVNEEEEFRLEVLVDEMHLQEALSRMLEAHPYEEVAYDVYPLANKSLKAGIGRIGELESPRSLKDFLQLAAQLFGQKNLRLNCTDVGMDSTIRRVAIVTGGGSSLVQVALDKGADVLITGEIKHHDALWASENGLLIVEVDHHITEGPAVWLIKEKVERVFAERGWPIEVVATDAESGPWRVADAQ